MKIDGRMWVMGVLMIVLCGVGSPARAEISLSVGMRYDSFVDDRSPKWEGTELTVPFGALYTGEQFLLRIESAYSRAAVTPGADADADLSGLTDTLLSVSYLFPDWPVGLMLGLDLNLPSGQERLSRRERMAEAGERHDLFEVDNFGEGFNAGLNVGVAKELGPLNLALTSAYIVKGEYDSTADTSDDDVDPGDQVMAMGMLTWKFASGLTLEGSAAYSHVRPDTSDGEKSFQDGPKALLSAAARMQGQTTNVTAGLQYTTQDKNRELVSGSLDTEPANSNGTELFGWFDAVYRLSSRFDLQLLGDVRWYGESDRVNAWNGLPFEGRRIRYAGGPGILFAQNDRLSWNAVAKYFSMTQDPDMLQEQEITYRGINVSVGMTYTF